jgi:NADH-quinone oxidoreductase subunit E
MTTQTEAVELWEQTKQAIDEWAKKFPADQSQSAVLYALHLVQENNGGWLTEPLLEAVADYLNMTRMQIFEVATFYDMYDLEPTGYYKLRVCNSISCHLMGAETIIEHIKNKFNIAHNQTSTDGQFVFKEVECLGACRCGPVMLLDKTYYEHLTPDKVDEIIEQKRHEH